MKKLLSMLSFVLMLACVGFAFTSCGDDDDDEPEVSSSIVAKWMTEKQAGAYGTITFRKNGTFSMGVYVPEEMMMNSEFVKDAFEKTKPKIEGTYSTEGDKIHITATKYVVGEMDLTKYLKVPTQTATYSVSKDKKTLKINMKDYYSGTSETQVYTRM